MSDLLEIGKEYPPAGEDAAIANLRDLHLKVQHVQPGPNRRGEHPKQHAGVWAAFTVRTDIPPEFRIGIFKEARGYTAFVRFSNGRTADDRLPDAHGMAVKVLIPQEGQAAPLQQDFLTADHPIFFAENVQRVFDFLAATASGTPSSQLAATTYPKLIGFTSVAKSNLLNTTYWSQTPYKLGDGAVKYLALPSPDNPVIPLDDSPDCLRGAMHEQLTFRKIAAQFDFCIVPQTDAKTMPVEDPTVEWTSAPVRLATLSIYPQKFDSPEQMTFVENLQWSPWNSLPEHSPLGGINRARRGVYQDSQDLRHRTNQVQALAPTGRESF
jgi:hypothetical protein